MGAKERGRNRASGETVAPRSDRLRARLVVLLAIGFVAFFALVVALKLAREHRETLIAEERNLAADATSLGAQFGARLRELESIGDQAAAAWGSGETRLAVPTLPALIALGDRVEANAVAADLVVLSAGGRLLYRAAGPPDEVPDDWNAASFLALYEDGADDGLYLVDGGELLLARRFTTETGEATALAIVPVVSNFARLLAATVNFDARKHVAVAAADGTLLDYAPRTSEAVGSLNAVFGIEWPPRTARGAPLVEYARNSAGEDLLVVGRAVTGTPFYVLVAARVDDVLASWSADLFFYALIVLAPSLFGAAVCTILLFQMAEQRAVNRERSASETRLNLTIAGARCGIWDWDLDTNRVVWSPSMYAMLGRSDGRPDLDLADIRALMPVNDRPILDTIAEAAARKDGAYDEVFRLRHAHGHWIWVHAKGQAYAESGGGDRTRHRRLMGVALDITQLKQAEARIAEAEAQLREAVENISEAFILWDSQDRLLLCNKNFSAFYQIDPEVLKSGARRREVMAAAATPVEILHEENAAGSADEPSPLSVELQHVGSRWLHVSTRTIKDGGRVSVGTDVTPLKEQEAELLRNERRLKEYVEVLKASETNLRKEASQRAELASKYGREKARAEEAARSKTEFLANMSHELRTPLNAIMGFAQIMQDGMFGALGDERYRDYTGHILQSAQHLLDLINDILDMSKIESGKMHLDVNDIDLNDVVSTSARFIEPKVFEAGLHFKLTLPELPTVYADARATKQTLINLLTNAVKFTQRGGTITLGGNVEADSVTLYVEDTGIGISAEDLPRVCEPFVQIESQRSKKHKGSGLGLALAKSLTELQGGELLVSSQLGLGTTVRITLPRRAPRADAA